MKKKNGLKIFEILIGVAFILFSLGFGYYYYEREGVGYETSPYVNQEKNVSNSDNIKQDNNFLSSDKNLKVHFIDVGQGDSCLIELNGKYMLIDAGTNESENSLVKYLKDLGIKEFEYVIGTHAHEDHIGGMDKVIQEFDVKKILFAKHTTTTRTFENFVTAVKNKNLQLYAPYVNETFNFEDASFTVLAPNYTKYEDINNYSIVIKFQYKNTSILFTGDAETLSENEMLNNSDLDLKADVIKIGHHGSSTSSSIKFLNAVNPKYAVISLGKDNSYGHPHKSTMLRLKALNIPVYRTDEASTIIMESDGDNIKFNKEKGSYTYNNDN